MQFQRGDIIGKAIKTYIDSDFRKTRMDNESKARKILDTKLDVLDEGLFYEFCKYCNIEHIKNYPRVSLPFSVTRFRPVMSNTAKIIDKRKGNFDDVKIWLLEFWKQKGILNLKEHHKKIKDIKNISTWFFSMLLYLKSPEEFNVCTNALADGLYYLKYGDLESHTVGPLKKYLSFNSIAIDLRNEFELFPQDVDFILSEGKKAWGEERKKRGLDELSIRLLYL